MYSNKILEMSKRSTKAGRVNIKIVLHKIHEDSSETNKNGIHWEENYVNATLESAIGIPICAEFADEEKSIPLGHGLTDQVLNLDGTYEPIYEDSEVVGQIEKVSVERVDVNGENILALVGEGVLYKQRYPNFVSYVRKKFSESQVLTSIEVMGLEENGNLIIYEEDNPTQEKRTCKEYAYSGVCILGVEPADDNATVLEVNTVKNDNVVLNGNIDKEDNFKMEFTEEMRAAINSAVSTSIAELNNKESVYSQQIKELNSKVEEMNNTIKQKDSEIEQKNSEINEKDNKIVELNASIEQIQATLDQMKKDHETYWAEREMLEHELVKAKVAEKLGEMNAALEVFTEAEQNSCKTEIDSCKEQIEKCEKVEELESKTAEINSLVSKIYAEIGKASKATAAEKKASEINSLNDKENKPEDIFAEICSLDEEESDEEVNIF